MKTTRYSKDELYGMFRRLLKAMGRKEARSFDDVGAWELTYIGCYGGWNIEEHQEGGGRGLPFGAFRRKQPEMYLSLEMAAQACEEMNRKQKEAR